LEGLVEAEKFAKSSQFSDTRCWQAVGWIEAKANPLQRIPCLQRVLGRTVWPEAINRRITCSLSAHNSRPVLEIAGSLRCFNRHPRLMRLNVCRSQSGEEMSFVYRRNKTDVATCS
jgi:hypothetical protein